MTSNTKTGIIELKGACYPHYNSYESRLATFKYWPRGLTQTPPKMAEAGLYDLNLRDHVRCFYCGIYLGDWEPLDDPITDHARWAPECGYIQLVKGEAFV